MSSRLLALPGEQVGFAGKERLLAAIIDNLLAGIVAMLVAKSIGSGTAIGAIAVAAYLSYFFVSEWLWSTTSGKALFRLRVETVFGGDCTVKGALVRTLFRILEVNPIFLGAIPGGIAIMMSSHKQRLGDRFGGVVVVRKQRIKEAAPEPVG